MFQVPVTFCAPLADQTPQMRRLVMHEFAVHGAKHLVLTSSLIEQCMREYKLPGQLQKEMAAEGLTFVDSHAPFQGCVDPIYPDASYRRQMITRLKLCLNICAENGVDTFTVHVGNDFHYPEIPLETHRRNIEDALSQILPEAEACGVTVCIENIWVRSNVSSELIRYVKLFSNPFLGLCFDSGHANLMEKGMNYETNSVTDLWKRVGCEPIWQEHILEDMLPFTVNCHLHDNFGQFDDHTLPGKGNIDWQHIVTLLKQAPRLKNIQSEVDMKVATSPSIGELVSAFDQLGEL